jgi:hypothetical protein
MLTPDEVSRLYDIRDITRSDRKKIVCPLPDHRHHNYTPSFSIFFTSGKQRWHCHGCGRGGDVIDLVGYMNVPGYDPENSEKLKTAINILTGGQYSSSPVIPPPPKPTSLYQGEWKNYLPAGDVVREYALGRGITEEVFDRFLLGEAIFYNSLYMTIPAFHDGVLQAVKLRKVSGSSSLRYMAIDGSRSALFNWDGVKNHTGTVFFVKGEIAALVLESLDYRACATTNGEAGDITPFMPALMKASQIILISDNDDKETTRRQIRKSALRRAKLLNAQLVYPSENFKDIDEWLLAEPEAATNFLDSLSGGNNERSVNRRPAAEPQEPDGRRTGSLFQPEYIPAST